MAKTKVVHVCTECGAPASQWVGRCPRCGAWNTLVEQAPVSTGAQGGAALPIGQVAGGSWAAVPTGVAELDRVLSGGLVPGSITLLGGEPGIGKSTLLLQALCRMAAGGQRCLLVTGEESAQQVRLRAERLETLHPDLWILAETSLPAIVAAVEAVEPRVLAVDSVQTVADPAVASSPGSLVQVRDCAAAFNRVAKKRDVTTVLVGHVTKEGVLAGPRVLEHAVDTVLSFEGDRHHGLRLLRALKHRFGKTGELGVFEMGESGLMGVPDASGLLLADRHPQAPGAVVVPALDGRRPLLVEVQALVNGTSGPMPRRSAHGIDSSRLALVLAVLQRWASVSLDRHEVYASAVGGIRVTEPAVDLALALALASAKAGRPLPPGWVACGEVGLGGELRRVSDIARRLAEAVRLGFDTAVVPASVDDAPPGLRILRATTVAEAIASAGCTPPRKRGTG